MSISSGELRPPVHLLSSESDMVADLAVQSEHRSPVVAAMLLNEIYRAELHERDSLPPDAVTIGAKVSFVDERTGRLNKVELVLPAHANIAEGRISILTPMGAALFGLRTGNLIDWPDIHGTPRRLRIVKVVQPAI